MQGNSQNLKMNCMYLCMDHIAVLCTIHICLLVGYRLTNTHPPTNFGSNQRSILTEVQNTTQDSISILVQYVNKTKEKRGSRKGRASLVYTAGSPINNILNAFDRPRSIVYVYHLFLANRIKEKKKKKKKEIRWNSSCPMVSVEKKTKEIS